MPASCEGRLVIVSGPSGSGKTTVMQGVFANSALPLVASVSATTRSPRRGEVEGKDYCFISEGEFHSRREAGEFLECCQVFGRDYWYGTLLSEVTPSLEAGKWVVLEIDVQGAMLVMPKYGDAVTIFIHPGSLQELERRLRGRGTEPEEDIRRRLAQARRELEQADRYRYQVINDDLDRAVREICEILIQQWETHRDAR